MLSMSSILTAEVFLEATVYISKSNVHFYCNKSHQISVIYNFVKVLLICYLCYVGKFL